MHKKVNVLKKLREAIIHKIQELGNQIKEDTKIDKTYTSEKEEYLVQWGESSGVKTKAEIANVEGAIAMEDLKVGDPLSIIISEDLVYKSDMCDVLGKIDGMSSETMLLLWSMKEKHNCNSKFKNYFDSLPKQFNTDLDVGEADCIEDCIMSKWTTHMVRGTWLSSNNSIFYYGLLSPLLDYLRRARNPMQHEKILQRANLENELEILEDLQSMFSDMLENLCDTDLVEGRRVSLMIIQQKSYNCSLKNFPFLVRDFVILAEQTQVGM